MVTCGLWVGLASVEINPQNGFSAWESDSSPQYSDPSAGVECRLSAAKLRWPRSGGGDEARELSGTRIAGGVAFVRRPSGSMEAELAACRLAVEEGNSLQRWGTELAIHIHLGQRRLEQNDPVRIDVRH